MSPSTSFLPSLLPVIVLFAGESVFAVHLKTKLGILDGDEVETRDGNIFYAFYNIPYGQPPVGELRFEPPKEAEPWEGVRDATLPSVPCVQTMRLFFSMASEINEAVGQEDCLYLDVFTPNMAPSTPLPVLVFIHGGAFACGASFAIGPEYFMDHPVILVVIQYRLNVFGFISTADDVLPGNGGMKDQSLALKWVKKNIDVFGGDPNRVTVSGESAGAVSVHLHFYSPLSTGLFHGAISESGSGLAVWGLQRQELMKQLTYSLATMVGCRQSDTKAMVKCLKKVPTDQLMAAHDKLYVFDTVPLIVFGPVVEPKSVKNAFLTESPWKQNVLTSVPWIIGMNRDEGNLLASRAFSKAANTEEWNRDFDRMLSISLDYAHKENSSAISNVIRKFYLGDSYISQEIIGKFSEIVRDSHFVVDILEAAKRHNNKVFFYFFDHRFRFTFDILLGNVTEDMGVGHGDELIAFFQLNGIVPPVSDEEPEDYAVSKKMCNYWVNFADTGDPNGKEKKLWQPFSPQTLDYLHIGTTSDVMEKNVLLDRYKFWKDLLFSPNSH